MAFTWVSVPSVVKYVSGFQNEASDMIMGNSIMMLVKFSDLSQSDRSIGVMRQV